MRTIDDRRVVITEVLATAFAEQRGLVWQGVVELAGRKSLEVSIFTIPAAALVRASSNEIAKIGFLPVFVVAFNVQASTRAVGLRIWWAGKSRRERLFARRHTLELSLLTTVLCECVRVARSRPSLAAAV